MGSVDQFYLVYRKLQRYVGWTAEDRARIEAVAPLVLDHCEELIDDFYNEILRHDETRRVLGGGEQIGRLRASLHQWLRDLVQGPFDLAYVRRRALVGVRHVEIGLPQVFANAALSRLRLGISRLLFESSAGQRARPASKASESVLAESVLAETVLSLNKLLDLDLAIIEHAYEAEYVRREKLLERERSEAKFRGLVESAELMIVILNDDFSIAYLSPFAESLTGFSSAEVQGKDYFSLFLPDDEREAAAEVFSDVCLGASLRGYQHDIVCRDGSRRRMLWNARKLRESEQGPLLFTVGHDITSMVEAQANALQSERLAAIGQTSTGLAHESRNALQRIQASAELLELEVANNEEALTILRQIQTAQEHLRQLFDEVRGYAADIILDRSECSLSAIWREAWQLLAPQRRGQGGLDDANSGLDLTCNVDHFRMVQVFRNLLENSLSACEGPAEIRIRCRATLYQRAPALRISVRDNGPGFNAEQRQRIFSPFYTTKPKGTGLGMAIVQRIVEAHGGVILVGNASKSGAEIVIMLPRS